MTQNPITQSENRLRTEPSFYIVVLVVLASVYGWALFAVVQCGSIAAVAYVFAEYSTQFVRLPELSAEVAAWHFHLPFIGDVSPLKEFGTKCLAAFVIIVLISGLYNL